MRLLDRPLRALIVEDNEADAELVRIALESDPSHPWTFAMAQRLADARSQIRHQAFDAILLDVGLPDARGLEGLRAIVQEAPRLPVVLLTGLDDLHISIKSIEEGAQDYLVKGQATPEAVARAVLLARRRKQLEIELREANQSLEAFNGIVSHDLRSPLNHVRGFAELLGEELHAQASPAATDYLGRIQRAVVHMQGLVDDLLAFSRAAHQSVSRSEVDLVAVAQEAFQRLREAEPGRDAELVAPARLVCGADPRLCEVLVDNLVSNAWKYTSGRPHARIEIGASPGSSPTAFFVRDNGVGFDEASAQRLFQPFVRLHAKSQFPGTGLGLATSRRVVERHGGTIWAQAQPDQGATFWFTLAGLPGAPALQATTPTEA